MSGEKHANIALFVAHKGCPNTCSFCNQRIISGQVDTATKEDVSRAVNTAVQSGHRGSQLAFFGGSFTAIDSEYRRELLKAAYPFVLDGSISGIRISTRPDAINEDILNELKTFGVEAIELGAQSMVDEVLIANKRGHTADDVIKSSKLIKDYGFELGLQMMTGLYKDTDEGALYTAREIIKLSPATVRIYPTVVLAGTELEGLLNRGEFIPQRTDNAVKLCAKLIPMFERAGIKVIRVGLHSGGSVQDGFIDGAYHPAFRELCESEIYYNLAVEKLASLTNTKKVVIYVSPSEISKMIGQKRANIIKLKNSGYDCKVLSNKLLKKYEINIEVDSE
ncbi:MAG: radical SAM protein [Oscillospiraceae bacterium]|nr:radical SAM protein [Oscillospiraceae bacterium]